MDPTLDIKSAIAFLDNEIAHLCSVFSTYKHLFKSDDETRRLMADSDSAFFNDLYIVYLNYISIAVSRLVDPATTGKKSNLSVFTLIPMLRGEGHSEEEDFEQRLKDIKARTYDFTEPRNQLVSHFDFEVNHTSPDKKAIPSFITSEFDDFYRELGVLMNDIREILGMPPNMYEWGIVGHGGGRKLLHRLQTAFDYIEGKIANNRGSSRACSDLNHG